MTAKPKPKKKPAKALERFDVYHQAWVD